MAVMENAEISFTLNYEYRTGIRLFRHGSPVEPIPSLRCMSYREHLNKQMRYDSVRGGNDFFLDDNGQIMIEQSSGNNKFLCNLSWSFGYSLLRENYFVGNIRLDFIDPVDSV